MLDWTKYLKTLSGSLSIKLKFFKLDQWHRKPSEKHPTYLPTYAEDYFSSRHFCQEKKTCFSFSFVFLPKVFRRLWNVLLKKNSNTKTDFALITIVGKTFFFKSSNSWFLKQCVVLSDQKQLQQVWQKNRWITNTLDFYPGLHSKSLNICLTLLYSTAMDVWCNRILLEIIYFIFWR